MNEIMFLKVIVILFCLIKITIILFKKFKTDKKEETKRIVKTKYNFINNCEYQKYQSSININDEIKILDAKNKAELNDYKFNLEKII